MLVNFTVGNFRSFKDEVSLRMESTSQKELQESIVNNGGYSLLPVAVIYGANSSGKSNLLKAMAVMKGMVMTSTKLNPRESLHYEPFMLDAASRNLPTTYEIQIIVDDTKYRYGFSNDKRHILSEYLFALPEGKHTEQQCFLRAGDDFEISDKFFGEGFGLEQKTLPNRLFLTVVAQFNGRVSDRIMKWFYHFNAINGLEPSGYEGYTLSMFTQHKRGYEEAQQFFRDTQLGFNTLSIKQESLSKEQIEVLDGLPEELKKNILEEMEQGKVLATYTVHNILDANGKVVKTEEFPENEMESEGSKKIIQLSGPLFDTLTGGHILLVDELDARLHPILTRHIVKLFMDPRTNRHRAQLIFNTHDTNLLNVKYFRRDQIWFTEKNKHDATDLYSLAEFVDSNGKKTRNDRSFEKDYINGRYGAIPFIGGLRYDR